MPACVAEPTAGAEPLDLHKGISHPGPQGCPRWPEHLRLKSQTGKLIPGRCRAVNLCGYCARLAAVETSEVLGLDALETGGPAVWVVLTTRTPTTDPAPFYNARRLVMRALKRRWPDAEYAGLVEFTTGYGPRSGGRRRPHWNLLLKGIPASDVTPLRETVARVWCQHVDATPAGQFAGTVNEAGGLMRYLALHFQKESQAPPLGWRGHRFVHSRGYFTERISELRSRAREQLQFRREVWKLDQAAQAQGVTLIPDELDELAAASMEHRAAQSWELVAIHDQAREQAPTDRSSWSDLRKFLGVPTQDRERPPDARGCASRPSGAAAPLPA